MVRPNPHIEQIKRDSDIISGREGLVCLDRNERISAFADHDFEAMVNALNPALFSTYPDLGPLYARLQAATDLPQERIAVGAGSDGIIRRVFQAFVQPGDVVVAPDPSYGMYAVWSRVYQADFQTVPYGDGLNFAFDVDALISKIASDAPLGWIANPDKPPSSVLILLEPQHTHAYLMRV